MSGEWIPAVARANSMYAAIQVGSAADWVPSCAEEASKDAAKHSCTTVEPCSSYGKSLGRWYPCASDPWDKVANWCLLTYGAEWPNALLRE